MKYAFISTHRMWPVKTQCRCLDTTRSGYYRWLKAPVSNRRKCDIQLKQKILTEYAESKRVYGSPRLHAALKHQGESLGRKRVVRLMNELQIHSVTEKKVPGYNQ